MLCAGIEPREVLEALLAGQYSRSALKGGQVSPTYIIQMSKVPQSATWRHFQAVTTLARVRKSSLVRVP